MNPDNIQKEHAAGRRFDDVAIFDSEILDAQQEPASEIGMAPTQEAKPLDNSVYIPFRERNPEPNWQDPFWTTHASRTIPASQSASSVKASTHSCPSLYSKTTTSSTNQEREDFTLLQNRPLLLSVPDEGAETRANGDQNTQLFNFNTGDVPVRHGYQAQSLSLNRARVLDGINACISKSLDPDLILTETPKKSSAEHWYLPVQHESLPTNIRHPVGFSHQLFNIDGSGTSPNSPEKDILTFSEDDLSTEGEWKEVDVPCCEGQPANDISDLANTSSGSEISQRRTFLSKDDFFELPRLDRADRLIRWIMGHGRWVRLLRPDNAVAPPESDTDSRSTKSGGISSNSGTSIASNASLDSTGFRRRRAVADQGEEDIPDDERERDHKRPRATISIDSGKPRKFACPLQKYDFDASPKCARQGGQNQEGGYFTVHRTKQHVLKYHDKSLYCQNCWSRCKNSEQARVHPTSTGCTTVVCERTDWLGLEQLQTLQKKLTHQDPEDNWYCMFGNLFPHLPASGPEGIRLKYSPYYDHYAIFLKTSIMPGYDLASSSSGSLSTEPQYTERVPPSEPTIASIVSSEADERNDFAALINKQAYFHDVDNLDPYAPRFPAFGIDGDIDYSGPMPAADILAQSTVASLIGSDASPTGQGFVSNSSSLPNNAMDNWDQGMLPRSNPSSMTLHDLGPAEEFGPRNPLQTHDGLEDLRLQLWSQRKMNDLYVASRSRAILQLDELSSLHVEFATDSIESLSAYRQKVRRLQQGIQRLRDILV